MIAKERSEEITRLVKALKSAPKAGAPKPTPARPALPPAPVSAAMTTMLGSPASSQELEQLRKLSQRKAVRIVVSILTPIEKPYQTLKGGMRRALRKGPRA